MRILFWSFQRWLILLGLGLVLMGLIWHDLATGFYGFSLIKDKQILVQELTAYGQNIWQPPTDDQSNLKLKQKLTAKLSLAQQFLVEFHQSWSQKFFRSKLPVSDCWLKSEWTQDATEITNWWFEGKHTVLVLLQNSQELRATGGFIGSYALLSLDQGQITELEIEDIYEADGQFKGFVEPPPGVKEYLSGGNGLRLPDANWSADFPESAQQVLGFLSLAQRRNIDLVAGLNLSLAEKILAVTGEVYLPDYQLSVNSTNLAQVARANRSEFFPGSKQKPQFLSHLLNQLKFRLMELDVQKQRQIGHLFVAGLDQKELQFFAKDPHLQNLLIKYHLAGELSDQALGFNNWCQSSSSQPPLFLGLVESNVGVNKANQQIEREMSLELTDNLLKVEEILINQNLVDPNEKLDYINYQRVLVSPEVKVNKIIWDGQEISDFDEEIITTSTQAKFKQIGFLLPLKLNSSKKLELELQYLPGTKRQLFLFKQSGLPAFSYSLKTNDQIKVGLLEQNTLIDL